MTQIGNVYAEALYSLAKEENLTEPIAKELQVLNTAFRGEPDFLRLLSAPNLSKAERCQILDNSFAGKVQPYVLNFMKILTEEGRIRHFPDCCAAFRKLYNQDHNILCVTAVTAVALTPAQTARLTEKLTKMTGSTIELINRVDPACYGGVRLDYDGKCVDGTVAHRLEAVRTLLKNTVL